MPSSAGLAAGALRSLLFCPGADDRKIAKALACEADAVILDLEDAVAEARKEEARAKVGAAICAGGNGPALHVRINAADSGHAQADLAAIVQPGLAAIWLPKAERIEDVARIASAISRLEAARGLPEGSIGLMLSLETARGVLLAHDLASASPRVTALSAGTAEGGDLHAGIGGAWDETTGPVPHVRLTVAIAARAAGLSAIIDGATTRLDDDAVAHAARAARAQCCTGKMAIHPRHIAPIHAAFAPSPAEVGHAREVVAAFAKAEAGGVAAITVGGRMVDYAMVVNARRVLAEAARSGNIEEPHD